MTFEPRKYASDILNRILGENKLLSEELDKLHKKDILQRDKNLCINFLYGVLQNLFLLDKLIEDYSIKKKPKLWLNSLNLLRISIYSILYMDRIPDYASISTCLNTIKKKYPYLKGYFHSIMSNIIKDKENIKNRIRESKDLSLLYSLPEWFISRLYEDFHENTAMEIIKSSNKKPDTFIRFPKGVIPPQIFKLENTCLDEFFKLESDSLSKCIITLHQKNIPYYIQSLSSGFVSYIHKPKDRENILDLCSGKGGKLIHFTDINRAREINIFAYSHYDKDSTFLLNNLRRWELSDTIKIIKDIGSLKEGHFSLVLLDVPCSGSGILAKAPDIRYKLKEDYIKSLNDIQSYLLEKAIKLTKPDGRIIYSTCSILKEENFQIINKFKDQLQILPISNTRIPKDYINNDHLEVLPQEGMDGITAYYLKKMS